MRVARQAAGFPAQQARGIDVARARGDRQRVAQRCERAPGDPHSLTGMITQRIAATLRLASQARSLYVPFPQPEIN
ncbi:hypothetical protein BGV66_30910 [Burkholderia ubonensis]|uniref:Uncharacterized protein n=1 Tax=Burkholderia ubonensis TaxID=101571 RepID=A0ABD6PUR7_9BURK|nr:hypothetical protein BGV66_30910 [Burkholderia ubonensis]